MKYFAAIKNEAYEEAVMTRENADDVMLDEKQSRVQNRCRYIGITATF